MEFSRLNKNVIKGRDPAILFVVFTSIYTDKYLKLYSKLKKKQKTAPHCSSSSGDYFQTISLLRSKMHFSGPLSEKWREFTVLMPGNGLRWAKDLLISDKELVKSWRKGWRLITLIVYLSRSMKWMLCFLSIISGIGKASTCCQCNSVHRFILLFFQTCKILEDADKVLWWWVSICWVILARLCKPYFVIIHF